MSLSIVEQVGRVHRAGAKADINHVTAKSQSRVQTENKDQKQICDARLHHKDSHNASHRSWTQRHVDVSL